MKSLQISATALTIVMLLSSTAIAGNIGAPRSMETSVVTQAADTSKETSVAGNIGGMRNDDSILGYLSIAVKGNIGATLTFLLGGSIIP